jgi:hypothetical protein
MKIHKKYVAVIYRYPTGEAIGIVFHRNNSGLWGENQTIVGEFDSWDEASAALEMRFERMCFWCGDSLKASDRRRIKVERTVGDNNGAHIEDTWFHESCATFAIELIASALKEKVLSQQERELLRFYDGI